MHLPIAEIISQTPAWVFVIFAYLIWRGLARLRPKIVSIHKVWIMPGVFIVWGLYGLLNCRGDSVQMASFWAIGAVFAFPLGLRTPIFLKLDREHRRVWLPGSLLPLLRVIVIFSAHYLLNVAAVMHPDNQRVLMSWDIVVSGASAGYFIGWGACFARACNKAEHTPLGAGQTQSLT